MSANKKNRAGKWRTPVQVTALAFFLFLTLAGKNQLWMLVMLGSLALTALCGRFYCGWLCPIHTVMRPAQWLAGKAKITNYRVPKALTAPWLRYFILVAFLALLVLTVKGVVKLNLILVLMPVAVLVAVFYPAAAWHKHLCPFGILFSLPGRISMIRFQINRDKCKQCGKCAQVCPSNAVTGIKDDNQMRYAVTPADCLFCFACPPHCPRGAIKSQLIHSHAAGKK